MSVPNLGELYRRGDKTWQVVGVYITRSGHPRIRLAALGGDTHKVVQLPVFLENYRKLSINHTVYRGYH